MNEKKMDCWEYMKCGREPGGSNIDELGICPAATDETSNNINKGRNAGRICWSIAGTQCNGEVHGTFARSFGNCLNCRFYLYVQRQEGRHLVLFRGDIRNVKK